MPREPKRIFAFMFVIFIILACAIPGAATPTPVVVPTDTLIPPTMEIPPTAVQHVDVPASAPEMQAYPDVISKDTAPEKRAPYGDSYDLNRLERPFTQDMTYIPDMDISAFSISEDGIWYVVSIGTVGTDPNNPANIDFSVELDTNRDGFGDYLITAEHPYSTEWTAENVRIFGDTNRDTAGVDPLKSDAPFTGNGFDTLLYSAKDGTGGDIDIAWVRTNINEYIMIQIAFKKSFAGDAFFYGVMADAGLKDFARLDYVDSFSEEQAGSPVRNSQYYPLKELYAVDNTCYQAVGFTPTGYEPKVCPVIVQPQIAQPGDPAPGATPGFIFIPVDFCTLIGRPNPGNCPYGWAGYPNCVCIPG